MSDQRIYTLPEGKINSWDDIAPAFEALSLYEISDADTFKKWLKALSDLESKISEDLAWRYIKMTCDTEDEMLENDYLNFVSNIQPHISPWEDTLNKKIAASPFLADLSKDPAYAIYFRKIEKDIKLFREENIPIQVRLQTNAQKFGSINAAMTVEVDGKELTLQQAAVHLKSSDRNHRQDVFTKIQERRGHDRPALDELLDDLIKDRHKLAQNAGFSNFRDYMHEALARFDYSVEDCYAFHAAVEKVVVPLNKLLTEKRKSDLKLDQLRPWDLEVDPQGKEALVPFSDGKDLAEKTIRAFGRLDPFFAGVIETMREKGQLDLDSRKGKAPGGYNYPLAVTGYPFIFMNAASAQRDLETMVHEGGHAIHSVLTKDLPLQAFKDCPSEVAELASMSMELISMEVWDEFYKDPKDWNRAKREQLEGVIHTLPWIATVDAFQHWLYTNPDHTPAERKKAWLDISERFGTGMVDWTGYEEAKAYGWQKQLHIYEVPFYYIEYGFAQLGAIATWKYRLEHPKEDLQPYKNALSLGYTRSIPEIYQTAGARFDFSEAYVNELFAFVHQELKRLEA